MFLSPRRDLAESLGYRLVWRSSGYLQPILVDVLTIFYRSLHNPTQEQQHTRDHIKWLFALWLLFSISILSLSLYLYFDFDSDFIFIFLIQFSCFFRADRNPSGGANAICLFSFWAFINFVFSISTCKHFATSFLFVCSLALSLSVRFHRQRVRSARSLLKN